MSMSLMFPLKQEKQKDKYLIHYNKISKRVEVIFPYINIITRLILKKKQKPFLVARL